MLQGEIRRNAKIAVLRDREIIHEGPITSLKHEKDDVREVREGFECGINVGGFEEFKEGDLLECFVEEKVAVV